MSWWWWRIRLAITQKDFTVWQTLAFLAFAMLIAMASLAGWCRSLAGFLGKFFLFDAAFGSPTALVVVAGLPSRAVSTTISRSARDVLGEPCSDSPGAAKRIVAADDGG